MSFRYDYPYEIYRKLPIVKPMKCYHCEKMVRFERGWVMYTKPIKDHFVFLCKECCSTKKEAEDYGNYLLMQNRG